MVLIFSKDRAFQCYLTIYSFRKNFGHDHTKIAVQAHASNDEQVKGYEKLAGLFPDIEFYDEREYGFTTTLYSILNSSTEKYMHLAVDDNVYLNKPQSFGNLCDDFDDTRCGKYTLFLNKDGYTDIQPETETELSFIFPSHQNPSINKLKALYRPFGVGSAIYRTDLLIQMVHDHFHDISNPWELEARGCDWFDGKTSYVQMTKIPYIKNLHLNNFLSRYAESYNVKELLSIFIYENKSIDYDAIDWNNFKTDLSGFDNSQSGFPEFPTDIPRKYHDSIMSKLKIIE